MMLPMLLSNITNMRRSSPLHILSILIIIASRCSTSALDHSISRQKEESAFLSSNSTPPSSHRHLSSSSGTTGPTISSGACGNLRIDPFPMELELFYYYRLDVLAGTTVDLPLVEYIINQAVIGKLNACDGQDRPLYALDLNPSHILLYDDNCTSLMSNHSNNCLFVKAETFILLDNGTQYVEALAFAAIQSALSDHAYLRSVQPNIETAQFVGTEDSRVVTLPTSASQAVLSAQHRPFTAKVAIAVASVSSLLAIIFTYGIIRRTGAAHKRDTQATLSPSRKDTNSGLRMGIRRRGEYLEHLAEEEPDQSTNRKFPQNAHFILSPSELSDITFDDSASMLSTISRTTSKLERIDEEGEGPYDEEAAFGRHSTFDVYGDNSKFNAYGEGDDVYPLHGLRLPEDCHVHVIDDYGPKRFQAFHGDDDKASDLVGCKYLDDASLEGEPVPVHDAAPMEDWNDASEDSISPMAPFPVTVINADEAEFMLCATPSYDFEEMLRPQVVSADDDETDGTANTDTSGENVLPNHCQHKPAEANDSSTKVPIGSAD